MSLGEGDLLRLKEIDHRLLHARGTSLDIETAARCTSGAA